MTQQINPMSIMVYHVISEPGDMTRYDYLIWFNEYMDSVHFMSNANAFSYPKPVRTIDIKQEWTEDNMIEQAHKDECNPSTLKECYNRAKEILSKENK